MLDNCKALVTYVKRVGLNKQLTPKLKQAVVTRWDGILIMTNSIDCEFESHHKTLALRHQEQKMDVIDQPLLHEVVLFLNLFLIPTKELEAFKTPMLHLVTHWRKVLLEHCDIVDEERVVKDKDGVEVTLPPDSKDLENIKDLIKD
jgi:hypothetical protein